MSNDRPEPPRPEEPDKGLDVDAAFAEIVARWEPSDASSWAETDHESGLADATSDPTADPSADHRAGEVADPPEDPPDEDGLRRLFTPAWVPEPQAEEEADDGGHFVPPPPPPLPTLEPRRKVAWICLVGTPVVALVLLVAGVTLPDWMAVGLVLAFVGGFGYLVATMGSSPPDDWTGDGAVL